jgi:predicted unusual protein kinase regulating ubiquinone biosynthesis (AarF/ABC1/UbiB family)
LTAAVVDDDDLQVLTQEYVPCIKISDVAAIEAAGIDRVALAKKSADSYMTQLCRHGFFHCDP